MEATKQTVVEEYQDRCVELEQRLADASEAINLIHDVIGTGGNGSETFTSIARRAVTKHEALRAENARLREALRDIEMETRHGSQWTRYEINEVASAALGESE